MSSELSQSSQEKECPSVPWVAGSLRPSPAPPKKDLGEQQWRHFGTPAEVSGLNGSSTHCPAVGGGCSPPLKGGDGCPSDTIAESWEAQRFPFPPPPSCCSLTQAGAERERHLQLHCCLLAPDPLPESKSFSKKTLNSFNRQLELFPHRSKGHELKCFHCPRQIYELIFHGREGERGGCGILLSLGGGQGGEGGGWRKVFAVEVHNVAESQAVLQTVLSGMVERHGKTGCE